MVRRYLIDSHCHSTRSIFADFDPFEYHASLENKCSKVEASCSWTVLYAALDPPARTRTFSLACNYYLRGSGNNYVSRLV
jgi:hypothetical protein